MSVEKNDTEEFDATQIPDTADLEAKEAENNQEEDATPSPEEVIEKLKSDIASRDKELEVTREQASKLAREKDEAVTSTASAQETALQLHERSLVNAIETETARITRIKKELKEARSTGDDDREFDLQADLAKAGVMLANAEVSKNQFETWKNQQTVRKEQQSNSRKYTPETQRWIDDHPRFASDREYQAEALAGDAAALSLGYQPDTPAYFNYINDRLARRFDQNEERETTSQNTAPKKKPLPAAAVSRDGGSRSSVRSFKDIQLTPEQSEAAQIAGVSEDEYKKGLIRIKQEKR